MKTRAPYAIYTYTIYAIHAILLLLCCGAGVSVHAEDLTKAMQDPALRSGFTVVVGCTDAQSLITAQRDNTQLVQGVAYTAKTVQAIRDALLQQQRYGKISVALSEGGQLPYTDKLVNVLVILETKVDPATITIADDELQRVLAPFGSTLRKVRGKWTRTEKAYPSAMSDWPMFAHDAKRSNVLDDSIAQVPNSLQWMTGTPLAKYMTNQVVTKNGRIFYARTFNPKDKTHTGPRGRLVARDAFNGSLLWKKDMQFGYDCSRSCMAADGDFLYTTIERKLCKIDAATGTVVKDYGKAGINVSYVAGKIINNNGNKVFDAKTGELLWRKSYRAHTTECLVDIERNVLITSNRSSTVCLDFTTGEEKWVIPFGKSKKRDRITLACLWEDMYFLTYNSKGVDTFAGFLIKDGSKVWERPGTGFTTIVGGKGWVSPSIKRKAVQAWIGLDPRTGKEVANNPYGVYVKGPRCYPARATERFLMPNYGGLFFMDPDSGDYLDSYAGRGTCRFGLLPSNGMIYQPVNTCCCYPMLRGDLAFAPIDIAALSQSNTQERLVKGTAFDRPADITKTHNVKDWPSFRNDNARSGFTTQKLKRVHPQYDVNYSCISPFSFFRI